MGLNKNEGEDLAGMGRGYVAPIEKWENILGMLDIAAQYAADEFHRAGAPKDITLTEENILIQEYHLSGQVVFIFWLPIKGEDHYYTYGFKLGEQALRELAAVGRWPQITILPPHALVH
jgi:hypothetical protein